MLNEQSRFDVWTINRVQEIDLPYLHETVTAVSTLTGSTWAITLWAVMLVAFTLARKWLPALAILTLPIGGGINHIVGEYVVGRTRPDAGIVTRTIGDTDAASFPSGHVMGAVMFYGMIIFLARRIRNTALRWIVQCISAGIIVGVGFARIWEGAHWPTDVLGAYAFGGLFLAVLFAVYQRIEATAGHLPFIHAGEIAHDEQQPHVHALTSVVFFNRRSVSKVYNPGFLPRALYWLAFQASFPYVRNTAALQAAMQRRNLAAMLTDYWYGSSRVARVTAIDSVAGQYTITSEYVEGTEATDRAAAKTFLRDLRSRFEAAGLPTWQIDPRQPRAVDNILETADGRYMVVDLESGLVSPLASLRSWVRAIRSGNMPIFDTVYFDIMREYVQREAGAMRATKGQAWLAELEATLDAAETAAEQWYASEPRVWSMLVDIRSWKPRVDRALVGGQEKAMGWLTKSVETWEAEGRIDRDEAIGLRGQMETPQFQAVVPHLGAHVGISVLLRFPFGSIARASWTALALLGATVRLALRQTDRNAWKQAWSIHNPIVIVLAAIPGFGTFAYLASGPIRSNRLLARVMIDAVMFKMPWKLYERMGMRRMVTIGRPVSRPRHSIRISSDVVVGDRVEQTIPPGAVLPVPAAATVPALPIRYVEVAWD